MLTLKWDISYVAKTKSKKSTSFAKVLQTKKTELAHCLNCDSSKVLLASSNGQFKTIYSGRSEEKNGNTSKMKLDEIWDGNVEVDALVTPSKSWLTTERYLSDLTFGKDATFFHVLKNGHESKPLEVLT